MMRYARLRWVDRGIMVLVIPTVVGFAPVQGPGVPTCFGEQATILGTPNPGGDNLQGTAGDDVIVGLGGEDNMAGHGGNDLMCGGEGDDTMSGHNGNDKMSGGPGNDDLWGGRGHDRMFGGVGLDRFDEAHVYGRGNDRVNAGPTGERDVLSYNLSDSAVNVDMVAGLVTSDTTGTDRISSFFMVVGTPYADSLLADDEDNELRGTGGEDHLDGRGGSDVLDGGNGFDTCVNGEDLRFCEA